MTIWTLIALFFAKVLDNALGTAKTILVQRNKSLLAGLALGLSNFIYLSITKNIVSSDSSVALLVVSVASGVGCCLAIMFNTKFSKEKTYVNVIMSDDKVFMKELRGFLAENHITNIATDAYTLNWNEKSIAITAYAETKYQSKLIDDYLSECPNKFKRFINQNRK